MSSSVQLRYTAHGMGGLIGRDTPMCRPVRIALMNMSSVQMPRPVLRSGVRFIVYEMPHGPANAVFEPMLADVHGSLSLGASTTEIVSGWPDSMRDMSGSGPPGPIFHGVWQSWQPDVFTRYSPRFTRSTAGEAAWAHAMAPARINTGPVPQTILVIVLDVIAPPASRFQRGKRQAEENRTA